MIRRSLLLRRLGFVAGLACAGLALLVASTLAANSARSANRDDDDDDRLERRQTAETAFTENCLMCHGAELTTGQRLTAKQWSAEVEKMVGWGSPLPPDRKDVLIAFLSESYPSTEPQSALERIRPEAALALDHQNAPEPLDANPAHGAALFTQHCAVCHGPTARGGEIGVNLVTTPILTRGAEFRGVLHDGKRRMPNFATVLDQPAQTDLLAYLRQTH